MSIFRTEQEIEKEYHVSWYIIVYKFFFGLLEFLMGFGIAAFGQVGLTMYESFAKQELSEDPHDLIIHLTKGIIPGLLTHNLYLAIYLMILGSAKIVGATGLIFNKNWGVDLLVSLTTIMLPFQTVQLIIHPSAPDTIYVLIGLFIAMYLINFKPHAWILRMKKNIITKLR